MFSSFVSYLFGSNTNCETNSETTATDTAATKVRTSKQRGKNVDLLDEENLADNFVEITSLTPSVTGAVNKPKGAIKRGKKKHNNFKPHFVQNPTKGSGITKSATLLTFNESSEEEFDENEWFIIEKVEDEQNLQPPTSAVSEQGENFVEANKSINAAAADFWEQQEQQPEHINSPSPCSEPRPKKKRNYRRRNANKKNKRDLTVSTLSPLSTVNDGRVVSGQEAIADNTAVSYSLCVAAPTSLPQNNEKEIIISANEKKIKKKMEESWFVTPPPCFVFGGPIELKTSPYENLLIEHPSMSVYGSITNRKEIKASLPKPEVKESDEAKNQVADDITSDETSQEVELPITYRDRQLCPEHFAEMKEEIILRNILKVKTLKENRIFCRTAMQRANKVRDAQSRNHVKRRSEHQHSKTFSQANNNRKSNRC